MTVVSEDKQGLYVLIEERVGRPAAGQGAGLSAGSRVRAALLEGAVRVRYGGGEQLWPAYASRRVPATGTAPAGAPPPFAPGQLWRLGNRNTVAIVEVLSGGGALTRDGHYDSGGRYVASPQDDRMALWRMVRAAPLVVAEGQKWFRQDGSTVEVTRVYSTGEFSTTKGGYSRYGEYLTEEKNPDHKWHLVNLESTDPAVVQSTGPDVSRRPSHSGGTAVLAAGQRWRTQGGLELVISQVDAAFYSGTTGFYDADGMYRGHARKDPDNPHHLGELLAGPSTSSVVHAYAVGQRWARGDHQEVTVKQVNADGSMLSEGGHTYNADGYNRRWTDKERTRVFRLLSQPSG